MAAAQVQVLRSEGGERRLSGAVTASRVQRRFLKPRLETPECVKSDFRHLKLKLIGETE